jgi:hypothetical protein
MQANYEHACLSMVKSHDWPRGLGQAQYSNSNGTVCMVMAVAWSYPQLYLLRTGRSEGHVFV